MRVDRDKVSAAAASFRRTTRPSVEAMAVPGSPLSVPQSGYVDVPHEGGIIAQLGFACLAVFLICAYSRLTEFSYFRIPHLLLILAGITFSAALLNGTFRRSVLSVPGMLLLGITGCMCLSIPFSVWRGGSFRFFTQEWLKSLMVFFLIASTITAYSQCRKAILALSASCIVLLLIVLRMGSAGGGRLALRYGTLANANDLAMFLLIGLPFCLFALTTRARYSPARFVLLVTMVTIVIQSLKTGSRAGLVTLVVVVGLVFWKLSALNKVKLAAVAGVTAVLVAVLVPDAILQRLQVYGAGEASAENIEVNRASTSFAARRRLLQDGIYLTSHHPLLGVGPGMFAVGAQQKAVAEGSQEQWQVAHNSYIEIASECGIPALLLYLAILGYCLRTCLAIRKAAKDDPAQQELWMMASCLLLLTVLFAVAGIFSSLNYSILLPTLAGLIEVMRRSTESWRTNANRAPGVTNPPQAPAGMAWPRRTSVPTRAAFSGRLSGAR